MLKTNDKSITKQAHYSIELLYLAYPDWLKFLIYVFLSYKIFRQNILAIVKKLKSCLLKIIFKHN